MRGGGPAPAERILQVAAAHVIGRGHHGERGESYRAAGRGDGVGESGDVVLGEDAVRRRWATEPIGVQRAARQSVSSHRGQWSLAHDRSDGSLVSTDVNVQGVAVPRAQDRRPAPNVRGPFATPSTTRCGRRDRWRGPAEPRNVGRCGRTRRNRGDERCRTSVRTPVHRDLRILRWPIGGRIAVGPSRFAWSAVSRDITLAESMRHLSNPSSPLVKLLDGLEKELDTPA